jgi:hypothetical protein
MSGSGEESQHRCIRWALHEHITPPCGDLAFGGLKAGFKWAANRDPFVLNHFFAQGILFSDQINFFYINEVADRDLFVMSGL